MGRSKASVQQRAYKLGLRRNMHTVRMVGSRGLDILDGTGDKPLTAYQLRREEQHTRKLSMIERRQKAIEGLLFDLEHGHDRKWAIKEAYGRGAPMTYIADAIGMSRWKVVEVIKPKQRTSKWA